MSELDKISTEILKLKREKGSPPFVVEFTGTPDSGKTSLILSLTRFFRESGWKVYNPTEGAESIKHIRQSRHEYATRCATHAINHLIDTHFFEYFDIVLLDRGMFDAYYWEQYKAENGYIDAKTAEICQAYYLLPEFTDKTHLCFFVTCSPETSIARGNNMHLSDERGINSNPDAIKKHFEIMEKCHRQLSEMGFGEKLMWIETTDKTQIQAGMEILEKILESVRRAHEAG